MMIRPSFTAFVVVVATSLAVRGENLDQFTYRDEGETEPNLIYPPEFWDLVRCGDLDQCVRTATTRHPGEHILFERIRLSNLTQLYAIDLSNYFDS